MLKEALVMSLFVQLNLYFSLQPIYEHQSGHMKEHGWPLSHSRPRV